MAFGNSFDNDDAVMSEINMTPLIASASSGGLLALKSTLPVCKKVSTCAQPSSV